MSGSPVPRRSVKRGRSQSRSRSRSRSQSPVTANQPLTIPADAAPIAAHHPPAEDAGAPSDLMAESLAHLDGPSDTAPPPDPPATTTRPHSSTASTSSSATTTDNDDEKKTPAPRRNEPYDDPDTATWEAQQHENDCWLASLAAMTSGSRRALEKTLCEKYKWKDRDLQGIDFGSVPELQKMLDLPPLKVFSRDTDPTFASSIDTIVDQLRMGFPAVLGVPRHCMVLYRVEGAGAAERFKVWDPANGKTQVVTRAQLLHQADAAVILDLEA